MPASGGEKAALGSPPRGWLCCGAHTERTDETRGIDPADAPVLLSFGKVQKDRFSLDFGSPFTPVSALFVALSTFANKLAVA